MELLDRCQGRIFDLLYRVDTDRKMSIDNLQVTGQNKQFAMADRATSGQIQAHWAGVFSLAHSCHSFDGSKGVTA